MDVLLVVYKTMLLPLLCYGILLWGGGYKTVIRLGRIIQNDALRAIFGLRRRDSVSSLFKQHDLLPIEIIYRVHVALLSFKISKGKIPCDVALPIAAVTKRFDRRPTTFVLPFSLLETSRQALAYRLPQVWGSLPSEIRSLNSGNMFVRAVSHSYMKN